ncbi:hypothetical protein JXR93_04970 [bacterium]|nr:hypothetical protein [bacterium]
MSLVENLLKGFNDLSEEKQIEVIDFIEFLKIKESKKLESLMDEIIEKNKEALLELAK